MSVSGSLITRRYGNFKGIDAREGEISLDHCADALNLYKNYKLSNVIETRPDLELYQSFDNSIFGHFFYEINDKTIEIVHSGTKLYKIEDGTVTQLFTGMKPFKSNFFVFNNILYIKDGINYLQYDGTELKEVIGYVPTTSISRNPKGGGTIYEDVNMLSKYRKNTFCADGESTDYYLDAQNIIGVGNVKVNGIDQTPNTDYTVNLTKGMVTFTNAPESPDTVGEDNVEITYIKEVSGYADRIKKCTLLTVFDNRVFFSGNINHPNVLWHSSLNDPTYVSDLDYYDEGLDLSPIKCMIAGNNALWVLKKPSQANTTIYYHTPTIDSTYGKIYPNSHSNISTGCIATGINFNDDIVFFSDRGMEGITSDITTEQVISHRSSFIDNKLLSEKNYENMILEEWEGYLLVAIDNKIYLADSRKITKLNGNYEYEWYYWEFNKKITNMTVKNGILYIGSEDGIYSLTNTTNDVNSYWLTPKDTFGYGNYQKTTNKKGCIVEAEGKKIKILVKTNKDSEEQLINEYDEVNDYIVPRIKMKKFKDIQLKISSTKKMKLESIMIEAFIGSYIKR